MTTTRYFTTYSGIKMPFNLVGELQDHEVQNRNTCFRGYFDSIGRLTGFDKLAQGNVELQHRYSYREDGRLSAVEITDIDGESQLLSFA